MPSTKGGLPYRAVYSVGPKQRLSAVSIFSFNVLDFVVLGFESNDGLQKFPFGKKPLVLPCRDKHIGGLVPTKLYHHHKLHTQRLQNTNQENRKASIPTRPPRFSLDAFSLSPEAQIRPNYSYRQWGDMHTHKLYTENLPPQPAVGLGTRTVGRCQTDPCHHLGTTAGSGGKGRRQGELPIFPGTQSCPAARGQAAGLGAQGRAGPGERGAPRKPATRGSPRLSPSHLRAPIPAAHGPSPSPSQTHRRCV